MSALDTNSLSFEEKRLHEPDLHEIQSILSNGLKSNFKEVTVEVVECPDLQQAPFHLASKGLSGSTCLLEIGGVPFLLPTVDRSKLYNLKSICQKSATNKSDIYAIGAGAGPFPLVNSNCEGIFNMKISADGNTKGSESYMAVVNQQQNEKCDLNKIPYDETKCALLANIFQSEGKPGQVIRVHCQQRTGTNDFITSIRQTLATHYTDKTVGLGGVFLLKKGKARQHVMRDFSKTPIETEEALNNWLKFYDMPATLIAVGTLITDQADLDLRVQHFHSFSTNGWGGHYHIDTTPDIVEYEGFFNIGEKVVRIDRPINTHQFGRD